MSPVPGVVFPHGERKCRPDRTWGTARPAETQVIHAPIVSGPQVPPEGHHRTPSIPDLRRAVPRHPTQVHTARQALARVREVFLCKAADVLEKACADVPKSVADSSPFTTDGQGPQRVSAGAPAVLQWCSSVVGVESVAHHNLCQIVPFCATDLRCAHERQIRHVLEECERRCARKLTDLRARLAAADPYPAIFALIVLWSALQSNAAEHEPDQDAHQTNRRWRFNLRRHAQSPQLSTVRRAAKKLPRPYIRPGIRRSDNRGNSQIARAHRRRGRVRGCGGHIATRCLS